MLQLNYRFVAAGFALTCVLAYWFLLKDQQTPVQVCPPVHEEPKKCPEPINWVKTIYISNSTSNTTTSLFKNQWDKDSLTTVWRIIAGIDEVCARQKIDYFTIHSTLWGMANMRDYVPWDKVLHFAIDTKIDRGYLKDALQNEHSHTIEAVKNSQRYHLIKDGKVWAVIYFFEKTPTRVVLENYEFDWDEIFPTTRYALHGFMLHVPRMYKSVLSRIYGTMWRHNCSIIVDHNLHTIDCNTLVQEFQYNFSYNFRHYNMVPKIIHQVWVGKAKKPPHQILTTCKNLHPSWEYHLWTDDNLGEIVSMVKEAYDLMPEINGKADIVRWALLQTYGGVWIDADTWCVKPIEDLIPEGNELFLGYHNFGNPQASYPAYLEDLMACSLVGAVKGHPAISAMVQKLQEDPGHVAREGAWVSVGPVFITNHFDKFRNQYDTFEAVYPFYNFVPIHLSEKMRGEEYTREKIKKYDVYVWNAWGTTFGSYESN